MICRHSGEFTSREATVRQCLRFGQCPCTLRPVASAFAIRARVAGEFGYTGELEFSLVCYAFGRLADHTGVARLIFR
jgi:hypothetical protein